MRQFKKHWRFAMRRRAHRCWSKAKHWRCHQASQGFLALGWYPLAISNIASDNSYSQYHFIADFQFARLTYQRRSLLQANIAINHCNSCTVVCAFWCAYDTIPSHPSLGLMLLEELPTWCRNKMLFLWNSNSQLDWTLQEVHVFWPYTHVGMYTHISQVLVCFSLYVKD